jgi:hypothetical protein
MIQTTEQMPNNFNAISNSGLSFNPKLHGGQKFTHFKKNVGKRRLKHFTILIKRGMKKKEYMCAIKCISFAQKYPLVNTMKSHALLAGEYRARHGF